MKKNGSTNANARVDEEDRQEDVEHALLRILGADLHDLLAVVNRGLLHAFQLDVCLDELDRAISAGGHRLHGSAGEPIDDRAAGDQAEHKRSVQQRKAFRVRGQAVRSGP